MDRNAPIVKHSFKCFFFPVRSERVFDGVHFERHSEGFLSLDISLVIKVKNVFIYLFCFVLFHFLWYQNTNKGI